MSDRGESPSSWPLRAVIGIGADPTYPAIYDAELLECGHAFIGHRPSTGGPAAKRRRCVRCAEGVPAAFDPAMVNRHPRNLPNPGKGLAWVGGHPISHPDDPFTLTHVHNLIDTAADARVGWFTITRRSTYTTLRLVHVNPDYRGRRFGTGMLRAAIAAYGNRPLRLKVQPDHGQPGALDAEQLAAWYGRHGFAPIDTPAGMDGTWMERPADK